MNPKTLAAMKQLGLGNLTTGPRQAKYVLNLIAERLSKIEDVAERARMAAAIFGPIEDECDE